MPPRPTPPRGTPPRPGGPGRASPMPLRPTPPPPVTPPTPVAPSPVEPPPTDAPPPPQPPQPPPPPSTGNDTKMQFQDIMAKKATEWDRMMGTTKDEERAKGLDIFRKLSDEEVDLANKTVTKNRLHEFVDLKVKYFDQLASETDPTRRKEGLEKFREVCEREMNLAKTAGPRRLLEEAEAEAKLAKTKQEGELKEEDKKKEEDEKKKGKEKQFDFSYLDGNQAMMPQMMPGMRPAGSHPSMLQGYGAPYMPKEKDDKSKCADGPTDSDIDKKLKLLSHLESARMVLQNRPVDSSASMAEEVRNRLRRVNLLQMKLVDEILESKVGLDSDVLSGLRAEKLEREKHDDRRRDRDDDEKGKSKKTKPVKEGRRVIVARSESSSDSDTRLVTTSILTVDDPYDEAYAKTTERCRTREEPPPEVLWERPERDTRARIRGPPDDRYDYQNYGPPPMPPQAPAQIPPQMVTPHVHCTHYIDIYPDQMPPCYEPPPPEPQDAYYPQSNFPNPAFPVQQSNFPAQPTCFPLEFEIVARGSFSFTRELNDVGVEAGSVLSDDSDIPLPPPPRVRSETTVVVRNAEQAVQTESGRAAQRADVQAPERVVTVHVTDGWAQTRSPRPRPDPSNDNDFAKSCHESLKRIADSVDDIVSELSSRRPNYPRSNGQQQRRGRRVEEDVDDPRSGAGGQETPAFWSQLCQSVLKVRSKSPSKQNQNDAQLTQLADRIHIIVQRVIATSKDVIGTRNAIQQGGTEGQIDMENVFAAEDKLWELIDLERQLADKLAEYRRLDSTSSRAFSDSISQAEEKIRRLIQVETKLATEIADWRKASQRKTPQRSPKASPRRAASAVAVAYSDSNDDDGSSVATAIYLSSSSSTG